MAITLRRDKGLPLTHDEMDDNFDELDKRPNGQVYPCGTTIGIKVDTDDPSWAWRLMPGRVFMDINDPNAAQLQTYKGRVKAAQFSEGSTACSNFSIPYDYAPGTDIYIRVNWSHTSSVVTGGSVTWAMEVIYSKAFGQTTFTDPIVVSMVSQTDTTPYHLTTVETVLTTDGGGQDSIDNALIEPGGVLHVLGYLDSNDLATSDGSVVDPFIHYAGMLYQSRGLGTKVRQPPYWSA